jgi:hypothetical protein
VARAALPALRDHPYQPSYPAASVARYILLLNPLLLLEALALCCIYWVIIGNLKTLPSHDRNRASTN